MMAKLVGCPESRSVKKIADSGIRLRKVIEKQ